MAKRQQKPSQRPKPAAPVEVQGTMAQLRQYMHDSRDLFTSLVLVLPLFILYQVGILLTGGVRNGADFVTGLFWWIARGQLGLYLLINLVILALFIAGILLLRHRGTFKPKIWPGVIAESTLYAIFFGSAVIQLMSVFGLDALLSTEAGTPGAAPGPLQAFVLSIGAGLYEETVFRLIGMGGIFWGLKRLDKLPSYANAAIAVLLSSVIFSAIHHIGALGDPFTIGVFMFRIFAGALLALIFYLRGFAVAVYTHAIYDIIVMVFK